MKTGEIVERGRPVDLLGNPHHPYTRLLIDSVPRPDWDVDAAAGEAASVDVDLDAVVEGVR